MQRTTSPNVDLKFNDKIRNNKQNKEHARLYCYVELAELLLVQSHTIFRLVSTQFNTTESIPLTVT